MNMSILKQISGESLRIREGSPRGFLQGGNYVSAQFQSMDASGKMYFQVAVFTEQPSLNAEGNLVTAGGESEWLGISVETEDLPAIPFDAKASLVVNAQKKALPAAAVYLQKLNPGVEFSTLTIEG